MFENTPPDLREKYESQLRKDPITMWQHRNYVIIMLSGLGLPFAVGATYGGWKSGLGCFLLAGIARPFLVLNSTFCINSLCHLWGTQPHTKADSSRDNWLVSLVTLGEGYHNYQREDRKSTRLNSSHGYISYAVFCLKKKKNNHTQCQA